MKKWFMLFVLFLFSAQWNSMNAQVDPVDTNLYRIVKSNNQEYIGKIISDDGREVLLETKNLGRIYIPKSDIQSISVVHPTADFVRDEYRGTGVFTTRYQFSTNAFPIEKNDNYALINLYGPEVHFSVSKQFSVGVMATWIASPIVLALKYTIPTRNEKINFGFGTLLGSMGYLNKGKGYGGLHWAMATYGDRKNNVTLSLGYSYLNTGITSEQVYEPGVYPAVFNNGYWEFAQLTPRSYNAPTVKAPIIGVAGIASVGKKASFVIDMMFMFGKKIETNYFQAQPYQVFDQSTGQPYQTIVGPISSAIQTTNSVNCLIMPGMRFQKTEHTAFQVSLAGIIGKSSVSNANGSPSSVNRYSFPFPMCTWFFKF